MKAIIVQYLFIDIVNDNIEYTVQFVVKFFYHRKK